MSDLPADTYDADLCRREHGAMFFVLDVGVVWCPLCDRRVPSPRPEGPVHHQVELAESASIDARAG